MDLNNIQKTLLGTIKEYKKVYDNSLKLAYEQMKDLPKKDKEKITETLSEIKKATKNNDVKELKSILSKVKNNL
jgi:esterase/lipase